MFPSPTPWIERECVARCLAEQIVRALTPGTAPLPAGASGPPRCAAGGDVLIAVAETLDLRERVAALVAEALRPAR